MKNTFKFTTRFAATAFATGALCCATPLFAQEDESSAQSSPSASGTSSESTTTGSSDTQSSSTEKTSTGSKASAGGSTSNATSQKTTGTTSGPISRPVSKQDQQFMQTAAKDGMKEVEMGKMAQQHGQSAEVKHLGQMLVADHTHANTELGAVAKKHAVKLDTTAPAASMPTGGNFDQQWLTEMIPAHQRAITLFQTEAKQGSNSEISGFASTTLPTLQKHLRELQAAQGKSSKTGSTSTTGWRRKNT